MMLEAAGAFDPKPGDRASHDGSKLDAFVDLLREHGRAPMRNGSRVMARCPSHPDTSPSLSATEGDDGRVLVHCHAGCSIDEICRALGIRSRDLFAGNGHRALKTSPVTAPSPALGRPPEPLPSDAELQRAQERLHGSDVEKRLQSQRGWGLLTIISYDLGLAEDGRIVIPFRDQASQLVNTERYAPFERDGVKMLPLKGRSRELLLPPSALKEEILITEGASDAIAAMSRGLAAVGAPSASTWKDRWAEQLKGAGVTTAYVVGDCDGAGRKFAVRVAGSLAAYGIKAFSIDLDPARNDGFDLSDYLLAEDRAKSDIEKTLKQLARPYVDAAPDDDSVKHRPPGRYVVVKLASEIKAQQVQWAWRDRVPQAALTVLAGQQGLGKSTLALTLCAQMTTGRLEGDLEGQPAPVLIVTLEDHLETVAKPRLLAAGADLALAGFLTVKDEHGTEDLITLPDDIAAIEHEAEAIGAKLLVIDPVVATLGVSIDGHKDQHVRRAFAPLAQLAERQNLAILGVMHLNKGQTGDLISRVSGSTAFTAAPRSVLAFARDPGDPDGEEGDRRVIVHAKSNWAPRTDTLACRIEQRNGVADGKTYSSSRLVFTGSSGVTAADIIGNVSDQGSIEDAAAFLVAELADAPKTVQVLQSSAKAAALAWRTVERAKRTLKIGSIKNGMTGGWEWALPEDRQPFGGLGAGGIGGLREKPINTGLSDGSESEDRQTRMLAAFGDLSTPDTPLEAGKSASPTRPPSSTKPPGSQPDESRILE
jgi:putative DNA primase/helicase